MKRLVKDLIKQQGLDQFPKLLPGETIADAINVFINSNCSALLVVKDKRLLGILSEKDYTKSSLKRGTSLSDNVESIMTTKLYYAEPHFTLEECLQIMSKVHIRHLPVIDQDIPIALLSMRHIMEALVDDKENQIRELTKFIMGSGAHYENDQLKANVNQIPIYYSRQSLDTI